MSKSDLSLIAPLEVIRALEQGASDEALHDILKRAVSNPEDIPDLVVLYKSLFDAEAPQP